MVFDSLATLTAALLTARDGDRAQLATTITRMYAGFEPPWMGLRLVFGKPAISLGSGIIPQVSNVTEKVFQFLSKLLQPLPRVSR